MSMKKWQSFCAAIRKINKFGLYLAVICAIAMPLLITVEVAGRTFFSKSTLICDEYTGYMLCAMTFFGGAYSLEEGAFLRVDILYERFKGRFRQIVDIVNWLVGLIYVVFLLRFCYSVFIYSWEGNVVSISYSRTKLAYPQATMLIGCVMLLIQVIIELINAIIGGDYREEAGDT